MAARAALMGKPDELHPGGAVCRRSHFMAVFTGDRLVFALERKVRAGMVEGRTIEVNQRSLPSLMLLVALTAGSGQLAMVARMSGQASPDFVMALQTLGRTGRRKKGMAFNASSPVRCVAGMNRRQGAGQIALVPRCAIVVRTVLLPGIARCHTPTATSTATSTPATSATAARDT